MNNRGRASVWVLIVLVAAAAVAAVVVATRLRNAPEQGTLRTDAAMSELERLQEDLQAVITANQSAAVITADLEGYVRKFPDQPDAWLALGQAWGYGNNAQKAYDALVQSLTLNPRQPDAAVLAGTYALGLKRYDESEKWYKRAVALEPQSVKARRHLATFYQNRGRLVEAEAELLEAQRLHPGDADVAAQLAMAVEQQPGREAEALVLLDDAMARSALLPADRQKMLAQVYADVMLRRGRTDKALEALEALPPAQQFEPDIMQRLATCWSKLGEPQKAAQRYTERLIFEPTDADAAAQATHWWLEAGNLDKARQLLRTLRQLESHSPRAEALEQAINQAAEQQNREH